MAESFTITRTLPHPRDRVWDAWTRPDEFSMWFGGEEAEIPLESLHYRAEPGERWSATLLLPDGLLSDFAGEFHEVVPPSHLFLSLGSDPDAGASATLTVDLAEAGAGTLVTLTQAGDGIPEEGWNAFLDTMDELLANPLP